MTTYPTAKYDGQTVTSRDEQPYNEYRDTLHRSPVIVGRLPMWRFPLKGRMITVSHVTIMNVVEFHEVSICDFKYGLPVRDTTRVLAVAQTFEEAKKLGEREHRMREKFESDSAAVSKSIAPLFETLTEGVGE